MIRATHLVARSFSVFACAASSNDDEAASERFRPAQRGVVNICQVLKGPLLQPTQFAPSYGEQSPRSNISFHRATKSKETKSRNLGRSQRNMWLHLYEPFRSSSSSSRSRWKQACRQPPHPGGNISCSSTSRRRRYPTHGAACHVLGISLSSLAGPTMVT